MEHKLLNYFNISINFGLLICCSYIWEEVYPQHKRGNQVSIVIYICILFNAKLPQDIYTCSVFKWVL